jgi:hypothetical protein
MLTVLAGIISARHSNAADAATVASADSKLAKTTDKSPMSSLPSATGAHLEKIKALGDGQWVSLGMPAPDPKWGGARGRGWAEMSYAPEMRAAFLYGEGVHGYTKPDGYYMDDLWAYDVNAHRWICLYPGTDTKNVSLRMDKNGFEVDESGQPIPVAQMGHGFNMVTYDTDRKKLMFMPAAVSNFKVTGIGARRKAWGGFDAWPYTPQNCSPWMYIPAAGKFELLKTQGPFPAGHFEAGAVLYSSGSKKVFYSPGGDTVWNYDPQSNAWTNVKTKGPRPPWGIDAGVCMDTKRDRIYIGGGYYPCVPKSANSFWCYDMKTSTWIDLKPKGEPCKGCNRYGPNNAAMNYDSVNDVVVLFYYLTPQSPEMEGNYDPGPESKGVYVYDPNTNSWSDKLQSLPKEFHGCGVNAFYCPELNAHIMHCAGDSAEGGVISVYRYKQAKK